MFEACYNRCHVKKRALFILMFDKNTDQLSPDIVFEDSRFLVLNKPSGMAVHGGSGLSYGAIESLRALRPSAPYLELAHRLDRDTSGCLLVAKRRSALRAFHKQQQQGHVQKHYLALVKGQWQGGHRKIKAALKTEEIKQGGRFVCIDSNGKYAVSFFSPLQRFEEATLMRVKLMTGRTHQIRVHAQHSGHVIAGDAKYGERLFNQAMEKIGLQRLFLHSESMRFTLPDVGAYEVQTPFETALEDILAQLTPL